MLNATFLFVVVSMLLAGCAQTSVTVSKTGEIVGATKTFGAVSKEVVGGLKEAMEKACSPQDLKMATTSNRQQNTIIPSALIKALSEGQDAGTQNTFLIPLESEFEQVKGAWELVKGLLWDVFTLHGSCVEKTSSHPSKQMLAEGHVNFQSVR